MWIKQIEIENFKLVRSHISTVGAQAVSAQSSHASARRQFKFNTCARRLVQPSVRRHNLRQRTLVSHWILGRVRSVARRGSTLTLVVI